MRIKTVLTLAFLAALVFVGVKFGIVYANRLQFHSAMSAEALDARRTKNVQLDGFIREINRHVQMENVHVPEEIEFTVTGLNEPNKDLVVVAEYTEVVDLLVKKFPLKMRVEARADAPK